MKKKIFGKHSFLSLLVILALLAAMALTFTACDNEKTPEAGETSAENEQALAFTVEVTKADGSKKSFSVSSAKSNVGDALVEEGLITGEDGAYGWYVTAVDGEFHKWEEDGKYWAFYINGEYAMTGVSSTPITEGATYSFVAE